MYKVGEKMAKNNPREMSEIQREAQEAYFKAGLAQYTIKVNEEELENLNSKLFNLNHEAAARQKLDANAATVALPKEESNATE